MNPTLLKRDKDTWRITKEGQAQSTKIPIRSNGIAEARAYIENTAELLKRYRGYIGLVAVPGHSREVGDFPMGVAVGSRG